MNIQDRREIDEHKELKVVRLRKSIGGFNDMVSDENKRPTLVKYIAQKAEVDKEYAQAYVDEVLARMDDGRDIVYDENQLDDEDDDIKVKDTELVEEL